MSVLVYYIIFCLATGITACLTMLYPALRDAKAQDPENIMVRHKFLSYLIMLALLSLGAPIIFVVLLSVGGTQVFKEGIQKSFLE